MVYTIKAKEQDGKVAIKLFGKVFDLTDKVKDGEAKIRAFGQDYRVIVQGAIKPNKEPKTEQTEA